MLKNRQYIDISLKMINKFKDMFNWKGEGTQDNPIIIDSERISKYLVVNFKTGDLYIHIKNLRIPKIKIINCQNILIENCTIIELILSRSFNIRVNNNKIYDIWLDLSEKNIFQNNQIGEKAHNIITNNIDLNHDERKHYILLCRAFIVLLAMFSVFLAYASLFIGVIFLLIPLALFTYLHLRFSIQEKVFKKLRPNKSIGNETEDKEIFEQLYREILSLYH